MKNFTLIEDETICSAHLNVSKDSIVGVNQTMRCYSARITEFYNKNKKTANPRTSSSLQHRWSDIQKDTSRFCGFAEIERRNQSGKSEDDKVNFVSTASIITETMSLTLYHILFQIKDDLQLYSGVVESQYRLLHYWFILHHEYKWNSYLASLSTPNVDNAEKAGEVSKDDTPPPRITRPIERDKAKKLRSSSASNSSTCLEVLQKMQSDRQIYEQRVEEATSAAESTITYRAERKLAIHEENLRVQQIMQTDRQRLEDKTSDADFVSVVRAERKLAIQEEH
jgi:hypothetical protein